MGVLRFPKKQARYGRKLPLKWLHSRSNFPNTILAFPLNSQRHYAELGSIVMNVYIEHDVLLFHATQSLVVGDEFASVGVYVKTNKPFNHISCVTNASKMKKRRQTFLHVERRMFKFCFCFFSVFIDIISKLLWILPTDSQSSSSKSV